MSGPGAIAGQHLVKCVDDPAEDKLADDVVEILRDGLRGGTDCDVGGVEGAYLTTLEKDAARRTEYEFMQALAHRLRERCPWVDGGQGLRVRELGTRDGWRFSVTDREGRPYAVEISFSEIYEISKLQRNATLSNFTGTLDHIAQKMNLTRADYFARRDAVELS